MGEWRGAHFARPQTGSRALETVRSPYLPDFWGFAVYGWEDKGESLLRALWGLLGTSSLVAPSSYENTGRGVGVGDGKGGEIL